MFAPQVGALIWLSLRPLLRLVACVGSGFAITKADLFPPMATRGASQAILNITLPCLMFSTIIPAFTTDNIKALGPLILVSLVYTMFGICIAWVITRLFWVPHRFRFGILVAGGWSNVGDIPIAVVTSICALPPFKGAPDQAVAVAYISVFLLVFTITMFPLGGHKWIAMDFIGPDVEPEDVREQFKARKRAIKNLILRLFGFTPKDDALGNDVVEKGVGTEGGDEKMLPPIKEGHDAKAEAHRNGHNDHGTIGEDIVEVHAAQATGLHQRIWPMSISPSDDATVHLHAVPQEPGQHDDTLSSRAELVSDQQTQVQEGAVMTKGELSNAAEGGRDASGSITNTKTATAFQRVMTKISHYVYSFFKSLCSPPSLSIVISFPIALIPQVKALFIPSTSTAFHIPNAPDGQPPLSFLIDIAKFIGGASVPLGLICLGSSLARLSLPRLGIQERIKRSAGRAVEKLKGFRIRCIGLRNTSSPPLENSMPIISSQPQDLVRSASTDMHALPVGAIMSLAIGKMLVTPVFGVVFSEFALVKSGLVDPEDKVLRFVCIFCSCLPTATTQVFLTQVYSGTGSSEHLSSFLIPQYALMIFSMTALTAYALQLLF